MLADPGVIRFLAGQTRDFVCLCLGAVNFSYCDGIHVADPHRKKGGA
jgi:hypothetical protein